MNLPETFRPKKNIDKKIKKLLKDKNSFDYDNLYRKLSGYLDSFLKTRETGWQGVFYISDKFEESRYIFVKNILDDIMTNLDTKYSYDKWELKNYYGVLEGNNHSLYNAAIWGGLDKSLIVLIYTSKEETQELIKDARKKAMLGHKAMVISI